MTQIAWSKWDYLLRSSEALEMSMRRVQRLTCMEQAFFLGYQVALARCFADRVRNEVSALCVSEAGAAGDKKGSREFSCNARNTGTNWVVNGRKSFVTAPSLLDTLLVLVADADNPDTLYLATMAPVADGTTLTVKKDVKVFANLEQGEARFEDVAVADRNMAALDFSRIADFGVAESISCTMCMLGYLALHPMLSSKDQHAAANWAQKLSELLQLQSSEAVLAVAEIAGELAEFLASVARAQKQGEQSQDQDTAFHAANIRQGMRMFGFTSPLWDKRIEKARKIVSL